MATVTLFLCCLLGSVSLVYGQPLIRLAASNEPDGTDHTGEIISFSDVGSGASGQPRPWLCYTEDTGSVLWLFPDGSALQLESRSVAFQDEVFIRDVPNFAVILYRGPTHFSPDGEHCCVRTATNERRCVTFIPCPTLSPLTDTNGRISYNPVNNMATYSCVTGYTPTITSGTALQITCGGGSDTSAGTWSPLPPTLTCTIVTCPVLTSPTNGGVSTPSFNYLTFAAYNCDPGYFLTSSATRQCEATGQWSGVAPTCPPVDCGSLTIPNGVVDTSSGTTFMMTVTYTCNIGYVRVGSESRTCGASITSGPTGVWSPAAPVCEIVNCGLLANPSNGAVDTSSGTTFMMTATYTCNTGYALVGANTRTCGSDGQWTPDAPTCLQLLAVISPSGVPMAGQSFSLTCSLSGGASLQPTLSYQWTREGGSLMTSTATLNFDTLYLSDAGQYSCQVILTSSQLEGEHTVAAHYTIEFMSLHIQLGLEGITNCRVYTDRTRR
ncbi:E-selectin-like [Halichondria panicea]|uniref:E-selectin-like n=1 Tax=Halichondria panicea TaxID=6063 RepID=UPI00312BA023